LVLGDCCPRDRKCFCLVPFFWGKTGSIAPPPFLVIFETPGRKLVLFQHFWNFFFPPWVLGGGDFWTFFSFLLGLFWGGGGERFRGPLGVVYINPLLFFLFAQLWVFGWRGFPRFFFFTTLGFFPAFPKKPGFLPGRLPGPGEGFFFFFGDPSFQINKNL